MQIILITYNRATKLANTFEQILAANSPVKDLAITIVDNHSTDATPTIVQQYQARHPNISYIQNRYNIGGNANIMKAFYLANKEYVWILADNDTYDFASWPEVERAIQEQQDAIVVSKYERPEIDIAQLCVQATFLPGVIYKTSNIDDTVMGNMAYGIATMFPHLALFLQLINDKKKIKIIDHSIVKLGDNKDETTGEYTYTRGYKDTHLHPYLRDMHWLSGYAHAIKLIRDKQIRNYVIRHNLFFLTDLTSSKVFVNYYEDGGRNSFNLWTIFSILEGKDKIKFLFHWAAYFSLYRVVYIFAKCSRPKETDNYYVKTYWIFLFWCIRTKLFAYKVKIGDK